MVLCTQQKQDASKQPPSQQLEHRCHIVRAGHYNADDNAMQCGAMECSAGQCNAVPCNNSLGAKGRGLTLGLLHVGTLLGMLSRKPSSSDRQCAAHSQCSAMQCDTCNASNPGAKGATYAGSVA